MHFKMAKDFLPTNTFFYPRTRLSPYFEGTQAAGAKAYSVYNHMYLPSWYRDTDEEYWALIKDVVIWDVANRIKVWSLDFDNLIWFMALYYKKLSYRQAW